MNRRRVFASLPMSGLRVEITESMIEDGSDFNLISYIGQRLAEAIQDAGDPLDQMLINGSSSAIDGLLTLRVE